MHEEIKNYYKNQIVVVGLSGGVDSSVAALLLKKAGYDVIGLFMQNWEVDDYCSAEQDLSDAKAVADQIGIPLHTVNFSAEYWDNVFQHCLDEFKAGRTPNPDVWCNREIKFKFLLAEAKKLGATYLATGHYACIQNQADAYQLMKSIDKNKDQSYFLYLINQHQLANSLFPLAKYQKTDIRTIAYEEDLVTHSKKDSTGICFIGERKFKTFLREFLLAQPGNMETPDGKIVGKHDGVMFYTHGQRKGLAIGGQKQAREEPWYVIDKDIQRNVLIVDQGYNNPLLYSNQLICTQLHWIKGVQPTFPLTCKAKTRYRQPDQTCIITGLHNSYCYVEFEHPQRAITPGQSVVFYIGEECLGGGIIEKRSQTF